jgi:hypothetical protein
MSAWSTSLPAHLELPTLVADNGGLTASLAQAGRSDLPVLSGRDFGHTQPMHICF